MAKIKFSNEKPLHKSKGFYAALAVCLAALALSSYTAVRQLKAAPQQSQTQQQTAESAPELPAASEAAFPLTPPLALTTPTKTDAASSDDSVLTGAAPFFSLPVTGEILKDFDSEQLQFSETFKDWRLHTGVDIAANAGAPVLACAEGVVEDIRSDPALGTVVSVDHGDGLVAFYCGLNAKPTVAIGQQVESGEQIGVIGALPAESVEQPHLHFAMEQDGVPVSPLAAMQLYETGGAAKEGGQ